MWLTARTSNRGLRAGVEKMRIALLKEAEALEKERSLASSIRSPSCRAERGGSPGVIVRGRLESLLGLDPFQTGPCFGDAGAG